MKLSTSLVAVKKITDSSSHSQFDREQVERLAQLILALEGIVNPLVVRRTSLQSYEVVAGHFEYQAAARAREIDPRKGEMISAYIIEPEDETVGAAITEQVYLLQNSHSQNLRSQNSQPLDVIATSAPEETEQNRQSLDLLQFILEKLESTERLLLSQLASQASQIQNLEKSVHEFANTLAKSIAVSTHTSPTLVPVSPKTTSTKKPKGTADPVIDDFNNLDFDRLRRQLAKLGFDESGSSELAKVIIDNRRLGLFSSISDVTKRVKFTGFSKLKVSDIRKVW